jgi:hypothetical protein
VWGSPTAVNSQIVMYLVSRIIIATIKTLASRKVQPFAAVTETQVRAASLPPPTHTALCCEAAAHRRFDTVPATAPAVDRCHCDAPPPLVPFPHRACASATQVFPYFAMLVWGAVLYLFEEHGRYLHGSLRSTMTVLYHDANSWSGVGGACPCVGCPWAVVLA